MILPPPHFFKLKEKRHAKFAFKKASLLVASTFAFSLMCLSNSTYAEALNLIDIDGDWRDATEWPDSQHGKDRTLHEVDGKTESYDSLFIRHYAPITNSQFTIKVLNSAQLSISGSTSGGSLR